MSWSFALVINAYWDWEGISNKENQKIISYIDIERKLFHKSIKNGDVDRWHVAITRHSFDMWENQKIIS